MKNQAVRCSGTWLLLAVAALCSGGAAMRAAAQCATFPSGYVPFTQIYATDATSPGSLVVGAMTTASYYEMRDSVPLPNIPGETFCVPIQISPGHWFVSYVPTAAEQSGDFFYYLLFPPYTQLYDPLDSTPYPNNQIPLGTGVFAWHIVGPALAPPDATQGIISRVNALYANGVLNSGQDNSLDNELQKAIQMMNAGKINGAIGNLQSFITEVQDLQSSGVLTSGQANTLIYEANLVIAELREE